ncbi:MAG: InlB B-repeat-containing protein [Lachnospiraceae bacterium]|nr:InlB B-repeat-containing protein [Lachnospiraceae bacterium]
MKSRIKEGMAGILLIVLSFAWAVGLKLSNAAYAQGGVEISEETFPDENFRAYVSNSLDINDDGFLNDTELDVITINVNGNRKIESLQGIEYFRKLEMLFCNDNKLMSLDLSANTEIVTVSCIGNKIESLDFSNNKKLEALNCPDNNLKELNVSNCTQLKRLDASNNPLWVLDITKCSSLLKVLKEGTLNDSVRMIGGYCLEYTGKDGPYNLMLKVMDYTVLKTGSEPETVNVTFVLNNGEDDIVTTVEYATPVKEPANLSNGDRLFNGWYIGSEMEYKFDFNRPIGEDITLYASWVSPVKDTPTPVPTKVPTEAPTPVLTEAVDGENAVEQAEKKTQDKDNTILYIAAGVLAAVLFAGLFVVLIKKFGKKKGLLIGLSIVILIAAVVLFVYMMKQLKRPAPSKETATPTPVTATDAPVEIEPDTVKYTMRLAPNDGIHSSYVQDKKEGEPFALPANAPVREGYIFLGWKDDADKVYMPGDMFSEDRDVTFSAEWKLMESTDDPNSGLNKLTLSGNPEDRFITDKYYYMEGEKFFLFLDKDLDLPGDFADNIAIIMDELEKEIGLLFDNVGELRPVTSNDIVLCDPWKAISVGKKLPIYVLVDRDKASYIPVSSSDGRYVVFYFFELYSKEFVDSVPEYKNNPMLFEDHVQYEAMAHELTHALSGRFYAGITNTMSEGSAEYYCNLVMKNLSETKEAFKKSYDSYEASKMYRISTDVTSETAETVIAGDFSNVSFANRGPQYMLGRMLCEFLAESYGTNFFIDYLTMAKEKGLTSEHNEENPISQPKEHAKAMKELYGADVFARFGEWYQENKR